MASFLVPHRSIVVLREGTLESLVPEGHLARFIWQVLVAIDFSPLEAKYRSVDGGPGRPPYHPRVLAALWIYGMAQGLETATAIAKACRIRDDFRWLAGGLAPSDQTLLNLLDAGEALASIWVQVLQAMHHAGHVDLSMIAEDGTKLRANASRRSFHTAEEIDAVIGQLKSCIASRVEQLAEEASSPDKKTTAQLHRLQQRLRRAEQAAAELAERTERRKQRGDGHSSRGNGEKAAEPRCSERGVPVDGDQFKRDDFVHVPESDEMLCPAGQRLRRIGVYRSESDRSGYRLYGRTDCSGCPLKHQCTRGRGRRVKVYEAQQRPTAPPADSLQDSQGVARSETASGASNDVADESTDRGKCGPQASLTDPEAVMMRATSEKRWEPSYNADLAVTRHGVIVSQFLTKRPTDFHNFAPALQAVISTLAVPESWVGDGHYGTQENLLVAAEAQVVLYAPPAGGSQSDKTGEPATTAATDMPSAAEDAAPHAKSNLFGRSDFQHVAERDVLVCPAGGELALVGVYPNESGHGAYRLYRHADCSGCALKAKCTSVKRRRVKLPVVPAADTVPAGASPVDAPNDKAVAALAAAQKLAQLRRELDERMAESGDAVLRFRRQTVEPANAHLKQHGLGRFHVRGLRRCSAVLTLACIAHDLIKWKARCTTELMGLAA